ncbi:MAG TPA: D-amino acid aminotransferase [Verrucomicrobiae bacterium]|nr:D-amino acid aminotransferase [Verrucomicrobiae bacterium]
MPEIAYVNGEFLPLERATVHIEDRGFQFADGVYEVVRTYAGKPFATDEHVARLFRSLDAIELRVPFGAERVKALIEDGVRRAGFTEAVVYLQITRGRAPRHRGIPRDTEPTVVMTVRELPARAARLREDGIAVITLPEFRWARCDVKSIALLPSILAYHAAKKANAGDAVFVEADGTVNESTAGNVFIITRGRLRTPPKSTRILSGVTRDKILVAAREVGLETGEERITKADLYGADEMFLTSTTIEIMPVVAVDGKPIGRGKTGPVSMRIYDRFARLFVGCDRVP